MLDKQNPFIMAPALALALLCLLTVAESAERPTGFRGIQWGTPTEKVPGLNLKRSDWKLISGRVAIYTRPSDNLAVGVITVKEIWYLVDDGKIVGVSIELGEGSTGYANCHGFREILRSLYGKPDESEVVASFHNSERWFATKDEEAHVDLTCSKSGVESKYAIYSLRLKWKGHARTKLNL